jgi:hypothetical protein
MAAPCKLVARNKANRMNYTIENQAIIKIYCNFAASCILEKLRL